MPHSLGSVGGALIDECLGHLLLAHAPCRPGAYGSSEPLSLEQRPRACSSLALPLTGRCMPAHLRNVALEPPGNPGGIGQGFSIGSLVPRGLTCLYVRISSHALFQCWLSTELKS